MPIIRDDPQRVRVELQQANQSEARLHDGDVSLARLVAGAVVVELVVGEGRAGVDRGRLPRDPQRGRGHGDDS